MRKSIAWMVAAAALLAGCTITQTVKPVEGVEITSVCIERNDAVLMEGFLPALRRRIEAQGITASVYDGERPEDCRYKVAYTANWQWDMAMYLTYARIEVFDGPNLVGDAVYDATGGGANMEKFGPTEQKIGPLIEQLFG